MKIALIYSTLVMYFLSACGSPGGQPGSENPNPVLTSEPSDEPSGSANIPVADASPPSNSPPSNPAREYRACGCGCCGGEPDPTMTPHCVESEQALDEIIASDQEARKAPHCAVAGCSRGVLYRVCASDEPASPLLPRKASE